MCPASSQDKYILSSVKNAMRILRLFKQNQSEISLTKMAEKTALPKSTVHRIVSTLSKEGFLSKNPRTGHYRLGLSLLTLGGVINVHKEVYEDALPIMESLVHDIKETSHLCLLEKNEVVYLYRIEGEQPEKLITDIGRKNPVHCTAEGLAILAFQDQTQIEHLLQEELYQHTPFTITDPTAFREELHRIQENGYVISKEQYFEGYVGIAAPIRDYTSDVVSSLAVIGPVDRMSEDRYPFFIRKIKAAAQDISEQLGYFEDEPLY